VIECIEDKPDNTTRFIVLSHGYAGASGDDRTSIVFSTRNESGSLYKALEPFRKNGVNLTRIESRPSKKINWDYAFFVDLEGHVDDPVVQETFAEVQEFTDQFIVLGSYPRAAHLVRTPPPEQ
jgi:chorismate mutase/prephenate dehydratase